MVMRLPPSGISGSQLRASRAKEWHEISMARAKPSVELSTTRPCRSASGAQAIECTTKSSPPIWAWAFCTSVSSAPSASTLHTTSGDSSWSARGCTAARALSLTQDSTSCAPAARATRAQP